MSTAVSDHITDLMLALPSPDMIQAASDEQLDRYRRISNLLDNMVFLERERRECAKTIASR